MGVYLASRVPIAWTANAAVGGRTFEQPRLRQVSTAMFGQTPRPRKVLGKEARPSGTGPAQPVEMRPLREEGGVVYQGPSKERGGLR